MGNLNQIYVELKRIMEHFNLGGPFFLCQGKIDERKELHSSESLFLQSIIIAHVIFEILAFAVSHAKLQWLKMI